MPVPDSSDRIAIVGVGGIFPGASDLDRFWKNIAEGVDAGRPVPPGRWFLDPQTAFASEGPCVDRVYSTWGCFIEDFEFDPWGLNLDLHCVKRLDPLFHLGLHAARAAFHDAGQLSGVNFSRVGVILGNIALPTESTSAMCRDVLGRTLLENLIDATPLPAARREQMKSRIGGNISTVDWHPLNRLAASLPAALIAEGLGFGGSAYTLDAACASSLYALKFACEELRSFRADAMLAGGLSRPDCQYTQMGFAQLNALSRRGRCAPLSAAADGLVVGEGAGVFVLKRLNDAIAAGDRIYGVVAGIGLSNDRGANLLAPHSEGQLRAMKSAYQEAGWKPSDIDLMECHATGTPIGDRVEIASLHELWQDEPSRPGQCVIGGVKSNVGHLLTGAGAAGLMKVLLAIKHQTLPPTANFEQPSSAIDPAHSPFRVLAKAEPWATRNIEAGIRNQTSSIASTKQIPRRATVNAFGFGGINAHALIEEYTGVCSADSSRPRSHSPVRLTDDLVADSLSSSMPSHALLGGARANGVSRFTTTTKELPLDIAIVGLSLLLDEANRPTAIETNPTGLKPIDGRLNDWGVEQSDWYQGEFGPKNESQTAASPITSVPLTLGEFRIPPLEIEDMLPQQQLMLKAAAAALKNAAEGRQQFLNRLPESAGTLSSGTRNESELSNRTGVFVGIELDPNTTNFHLRWSVEQQAPQWAKWLGLELTTRDMEQWIQQLKDCASKGLTANRVMGNLGGIVASRLAREFDVGGPSFTISSDENSGLRACELAANALRRGELDQAIVGAVDLPCDIRSQVATRRDPTVNRLTLVGDGATALVLKRLEDAVKDGDKIHAVIRRIGPTANGSVLPSTSPLASFGAATGLVNFTKSVISIRDFTIDASNPDLGLRNRRDNFRRVCVPGGGVEGSLLNIELSEAPCVPTMPMERKPPGGRIPNTVNQRAVASPLAASLFVIDGDSLDEVLTVLQQLSTNVNVTISVEQIARDWFRLRPPHPNRRFAMTFVVKNSEELSVAIRDGLKRLRQGSSSIEDGGRVHFSNHPLGHTGRLAFVFPGSGNAFLGMGRELLAAFPEVLCRQDSENERLRDQYRPDLIWNGDSTARLLEDHKAMIFGQVALGTAICDLLELFRIRPTASIGYSLGESAAFFGLGAWTDRDEMLQRMDDATLFGSDLVRPFNAARKAWGISDDQQVDWISGVIDRSATELRAVISNSLAVAVQESFRCQNLTDSGSEVSLGIRPQVSPSVTVLQSQYSQVYLLIVNTPTQCVIGGEREQVMNLVRELAANFVPFAAPSTVHCEILRQVEPEYRALHLMPTSAPTDSDPIAFYSTAWGRAYHLDRETAAEAIVAQAVNTIDFPNVIERAYADGVRLFVEVGPGSSCTRMIGEILSNRVHFARAATPATANPINAFLELLAALIAERVPVDLSYLYGRMGDDSRTGDDSIPKATTISKREIVTTTGGRRFLIPPPPQGWQLKTNHEADPVVLPVNSEPHTLRRAVHRHDVIVKEKPTSRGAVSTYTHNNRLQALDANGINVMTQLDDMLAARLSAHETYLRVSAETQRVIGEQLTQLASRHSRPNSPPRSLSRPECMEFAIGQIGRVLGQQFAEIDTHPTRVRLPDEPLMLVDRILEIEGDPLSMTSGRVVTEHDIHPGAWYLDGNRIPTCIAVEAGQADLFLSGWLGIDLETKGLASYRLLDAVVTFHSELPQPGKMIHYNIRINNFFRQGKTILFRFEFDATVDGQPLLTMREGCAGFFTEAELASGKGIVHTALDRQPRPGIRPVDWTALVPMTVESFDDSQLLCLRQGDLESCFGRAFASLPVLTPMTIPGIERLTDSVQQKIPTVEQYEKTRMWLIDRVLKLDPVGGKFGMGTILGELDIHPDDWFLTCHFCDDQVMPGTLMYECCLHTLRIFLLRMGWVGETGKVAYEPIPEIRSRLKCRGQVRATTKKVWYEVTLKEIGYTRSDAANPGQASDAPYCLADALMYADGKPVVEITDMSVRLSGLTRHSVERLWKEPSSVLNSRSTEKSSAPAVHAPIQPPSTHRDVSFDRRPALFDTDRITAFAIGNPSEAFGDRYRVFDSERIIARLPGPPFQFLDRIVDINGCQPWVLQPGGEVVAQYDVPPDAWYFAANRQHRMPFAVLLETALQPCGWLAGYVGSALTSDTDLSFRNLGGTATQYRPVTPESGTLTTTVKMTRVSNSGGMIIQHYDFDLRCNGQPVYVGNTYFGFFSKASLANQVGIRDVKPFLPSTGESANARRFPYLDEPPFADPRFQMIDEVELSQTNGPFGHGYVIGTMSVNPAAWFFKAHFHQDPVVPGSLGLESFFQLLKFYAADRWNLDALSELITPLVDGQSTPISAKHEWVYRGQVIPRDKTVTVSAVIVDIDDARSQLTAEGYLTVDGRVIYQMKNFSLGLVR